jgi:hypothetical protein
MTHKKQSTFFTWAALHLNHNLVRGDVYQMEGKYQFISSKNDQSEVCRGFGDNHRVFCHVYKARFPNDNANRPKKPQQQIKKAPSSKNALLKAKLAAKRKGLNIP